MPLFPGPPLNFVSEPAFKRLAPPGGFLLTELTSAVGPPCLCRVPEANFFLSLLLSKRKRPKLNRKLRPSMTGDVVGLPPTVSEWWAVLNWDRKPVAPAGL